MNKQLRLALRQGRVVRNARTLRWFEALRDGVPLKTVAHQDGVTPAIVLFDIECMVQRTMHPVDQDGQPLPSPVKKPISRYNHERLLKDALLKTRRTQ